MPTVRVSGSPTAFRVCGIVFSLIGVLLLVLAGHLTQQQGQFRAGARTAQGVVEGLSRDSHLGNGGRRVASTTPLVRFRDAQGRTYLLAASGAAGRYRIGERVTVYYDPERPANGQLGGALGSDFKLIFVWGFGVVLAGLGLLCLRLGRATAGRA